MSWNINTIGKPEDVVALVEKEQHLPQVLKDAVKLFAESGENTATCANYGAMKLTTLGHYSPSDAWSSCTFMLEKLSMAPPAPK